MLTIACLSQKGGVGKSTLSRLIATTYAQAKWRVKIADFNLKQKTSINWSAIRMEGGIKPEVPAEAFSSVKTALRQEDNYDLMVFDGRPDSDVSTMEIAKSADLVIIPTGVTLDDLQPQTSFAHELRSKGVERRQIRFVINKTTESQIAIEDAKNFITEAGYGSFEHDLPMKTGFQIAQNSGRSIMETTFPSLNDRAAALAAEIVVVLKTFVKEPAR